MCHYTASNETHLVPSARRAGKHEAIVGRRSVKARATAAYCSEVHRQLDVNGAITSGKRVTRELADEPDLADGNPTPP